MVPLTVIDIAANLTNLMCCSSTVWPPEGAKTHDNKYVGCFFCRHYIGFILVDNKVHIDTGSR